MAQVQYEMASACLSDRQRKVLQLWFEEEMTMEEAAAAIGATEGEVRGDIRTIRHKLKQKLGQSIHH